MVKEKNHKVHEMTPFEVETTILDLDELAIWLDFVKKSQMARMGEWNEEGGQKKTTKRLS